jgi:hypothetical protein
VGAPPEKDSDEEKSLSNAEGHIYGAYYWRLSISLRCFHQDRWAFVSRIPPDDPFISGWLRLCDTQVSHHCRPVEENLGKFSLAAI